MGAGTSMQSNQCLRAHSAITVACCCSSNRPQTKNGANKCVKHVPVPCPSPTEVCSPAEMSEPNTPNKPINPSMMQSLGAISGLKRTAFITRPMVERSWGCTSISGFKVSECTEALILQFMWSININLGRMGHFGRCVARIVLVALFVVATDQRPDTVDTEAIAGAVAHCIHPAGKLSPARNRVGNRCLCLRDYACYGPPSDDLAAANGCQTHAGMQRTATGFRLPGCPVRSRTPLSPSHLLDWCTVNIARGQIFDRHVDAMQPLFLAMPVCFGASYSSGTSVAHMYSHRAPHRLRTPPPPMPPTLSAVVPVQS